MQAAFRLARQNGHHLCRAHTGTRTLATTANPSAHVVGSSTSPATKPSVIPLSNVEAQWAKLTSEEKMTVHEQLEEVQKKDWKELSIDEKKAGSCFFCLLRRWVSVERAYVRVFLGV
jgi:cytochrome c oxidase subunit 4